MTITGTITGTVTGALTGTLTGTVTGTVTGTLTETGTGGFYSGVIYGAPFGLGGGIFFDDKGNAYIQLYTGTPGLTTSWGYASNVAEFLTGYSISATLGGAGIRYNLGGNMKGAAVGAQVGGGAGLGAGVTFGFGPYNIPNYLKPFLPNPKDPLVLDLTGAGIQLTDVQNSQTYFDFAGSGFATKTGWINPTEGLLVLDNGQGGSAITPDELVGADSGDEFGDLASLDLDHDGVIDANDPAFANLKVWNDANGNGQLDAGELLSLAQLGITSINLSTTASGQGINGNTVVSTSTFTMQNSGDHQLPVPLRKLTSRRTQS